MNTQPPNRDHAALEALTETISRVRLRHPKFSPVNSWIVGDLSGEKTALLVDTTYPDPESSALWRGICDSGALQAVGTIVLTHHHRDHCGQARTLAERLSARLMISALEAEALQERITAAGGPFRAQIAELYRRCDLSAEVSHLYQEIAADYADVRPLGGQTEILSHGMTLQAGGRDFEVICSGGHSPEAVSLLDRKGGLCLAGDQLLPGSGPQITYFDAADETDHLAAYLRYLDHVSELSDEILVLPGHGEAFFGAAARAEAIRAGHLRRIERMREATGTALTCAELIRLLFPPKAQEQFGWVLPGMVLSLARYLQLRGELLWHEDDSGIYRFERR